MAKLGIKSIPPFRDVQGRFAKAHKDLLEGHRTMMRTQGRRMKELARDEAPKGKTGKFAAGIRFKTFVKGQSVGFNVTTPEPIGTFIVEGTRPHPIRAKNAKALYFHWPKFGGFVVVPRKAFGRTHVLDGVLWIGKGRVDHPGTKPNPFLSRAFRRWLPGARSDLSKVSRDYIRTIAGAKVGEAKMSP